MRNQQAKQAVRVVLSGVLLAALVGCTAYPKTSLKQEELLSQYNANANKVDRVWARADLTANVSIGSKHIDSSLVVMQKSAGGEATAPATPSNGGQPEFVLIGREAGIDIFRTGIDTADGLYYFWYKFGDKNGAWAGPLAAANAPKNADVPVNPIEMVSLLSVTDIPSAGQSVKVDKTPWLKPVKSPGQVFGPSRYAYIVSVYADSAKKQLQREVYFTWSDTEKARPFLVKMYDSQGRMRAYADLSNYQTVAMAGGQAEMPTDIVITWPPATVTQPESRISLKLSEIGPKDVDQRVFSFRGNLPGGLQVKNIDPPAGGASAAPANDKPTTSQPSGTAAAGGTEAVSEVPASQ